MNLTILLGVVLIGITNCSDGYSTSVKCVNIASNRSGEMQCEPSKHIHIETISLDNEICPSKPSSLIHSIAILTCQGIRKCSVPFKTAGIYRYLNIRYKCTGCLSAIFGTAVHITCQQNTRIKIEDVWMHWRTACPAYKNTHQTSFSNISIKCNLKQTCEISNIELQIMSIYFNCEGLTTTNRMSTAKSTTLSVNTKTVDLFISKTTSLHSPFVSTVIPSNTTHHILTGAVAGGVVAGIIIIFLPVGVLLYRRRNNDHTKSPRKQFVTRSNPAYESDIDVGTDGNPNTNIESSLYHQYFEVGNDQVIDKTTHNYVNTDSITYDDVRENYSHKDDTYNNMQQGVGAKQQSEEIDSNTYSHLQDTFNDFDDNTYDHAVHNRVPDTSENDYSVSRGQMSDDDYDLSGNHYRGNHIDI